MQTKSSFCILSSEQIVVFSFQVKSLLAAIGSAWWQLSSEEASDARFLFAAGSGHFASSVHLRNVCGVSESGSRALCSPTSLEHNHTYAQARVNVSLYHGSRRAPFIRGEIPLWVGVSA